MKFVQKGSKMLGSKFEDTAVYDSDFFVISMYCIVAIFKWPLRCVNWLSSRPKF
jgi:hypothetical protein